MRKLNRKFIFLAITFSLLAFFLIPSGINFYIVHFSKKYIFHDLQKVPKAYAAIVLGARVYKNGGLSPVLNDRVIKALELYRQGTIKRFLLSGDHGLKNYDEVNSMKDFLLGQGVAAKDIFLDHAGFRTYDSIVRAKKIFQAENVIIVSQGYHLYRAVYIARKQGITAFGYRADRRRYKYMRNYKIREFFANVKAFFDVAFSIQPRFLGNTIPITGDSRLSWD